MIRTSRHGLLYTSTGIPGSVARVTVVIRLGLEQSYTVGSAGSTLYLFTAVLGLCRGADVRVGTKCRITLVSAAEQIGGGGGGCRAAWRSTIKPLITMTFGERDLTDGRLGG